MKAVILVGGEGTRLRPLTYSLPKQLLPICNMTMLERVVNQLKKAGINEVVLSLGYKPDAFLEAFPAGKILGVSFVCAQEPELLDTAGAIRFACEAANIKEAFLAINGDVISSINLSSFVSSHKANKGLATVALTTVDDPSRFGVAKLNKENQIESFVEKPNLKDAPSNLINAGYYVLEKEVLDLIKKGRRVSIEREIFPLLAREKKLFGYPSSAYWIDTGTPLAYIEACLDILEKKVEGNSVPFSVEVDHNVYVVGNYERIPRYIAPVLIGSSCMFKKEVLIEKSILEKSVKVGEATVISNSVVFENVAIEDNCQIKNSIIGAGSKILDGAKVEGCVIGFNQVIEQGKVIVNSKVPEIIEQ